MNDLDKKIQSLVSEQKYDELLPLVNKFVNDNNDNFYSYFLLGFTYNRLKDYDNAIIALKRSLEFNTSHLQTYWEIGNAYNFREEYLLAEKYYKDALTKDDSNLTTLKLLGKFFSKKYNQFNIDDDLVKSNFYFNTALDLYPKDDNVILSLASNYQIMRKYKESYSLFFSLKGSNDSLPFYVNYSALLTRISYNKECYEILEEGLEKYPESQPLLNNLSSLALADNNYILARETIEKSLKLNNKSPNALLNYGCLYFYQNNYKKAFEYFQKSLETNKQPATYIMLGEYYKASNKLEDARKSFLKAIDLDEYSPAYYPLTEIMSFKDNEPIVNKIKSLSLDKNLPANFKSTYYFSLWNIYKDNQKQEQAFEYLVSANKLIRETIDYSTNESKIKIQNLINQDYSILKEPTKSKSPNIIFIIGMPRSGTSLIEQILSSHSLVEGYGELLNLPLALSKNNYLTKFNKNKRTILSDIHNDYYALLNNKSQNVRYITDKMPTNFLYLPFIIKAFPGSKIIHIKRNKLDNCFSIYERKFQGQMPWAYEWRELLDYYDLYDEQMHIWNNQFGNIFNIQYEDIVGNIEMHIKEMLKFCDLEFEESCVKFYENKRTVITASFDQVRKKIYTTSIGRSKDFVKYIDN